jgi:hypothetical protein
LQDWGYKFVAYDAGLPLPKAKTASGVEASDAEMNIAKEISFPELLALTSSPDLKTQQYAASILCNLSSRDDKFQFCDIGVLERVTALLDSEHMWIRAVTCHVIQNIVSQETITLLLDAGVIAALLR